jgi:hypothetical protein
MHRNFAYFLASEWPYGMTMPTFAVYANDTQGTNLDLWDESIYIPVGTVNAEVRQLRDLYVQLNKAEQLWALDWLRYGEFQPLADVDFTTTTTTQGFANGTWATYFTLDTVYDRVAYPCVVHGIWKRPSSGTVTVFLVNWSHKVARWTGALDLSFYGVMTPGSSVNAYQRDYLGGSTFSQTFTSPQVTLDVKDIPAYTLTAFTFSKETADTSVDPEFLGSASIQLKRDESVADDTTASDVDTHPELFPSLGSRSISG